MPYKTEQRQKLLIKTALTDPEIQSAKEKARIDIELLVEPFKNDFSKIWSVAVENISNFDIIEKDILKLKEKIRFDVNELKKSKYDLYKTITVLLQFFLFGSIIIFISFLGYKYFNTSWKDTIKIVSDEIVSISIYFFLLVSSYLVMNLVTKIKERYIERVIDEMSKEVKLYLLEARRDKLEEEIDTMIIETVLKPQMRAIINVYLKPSYAINLENIYASGLSGVFILSQTINTKAQSRLDFLFTNMTGGSIGISGPRGAGKSTLIQNYCGPNRVVEKIKDKKILSVFTTAPVEYDSRDFIIHLFTSVIDSFLKLEGEVSNNNRLNSYQIGGNSNNMFVDQAILSRIRNFFFSFGLLFITFSFVIVLCNNPKILGFPYIFNINLFHLFDIQPGTVFKFGLTFFIASFFIEALLSGTSKRNSLQILFELLLQNRQRKKRSILLENIENGKEAIVNNAKQLLQKIKFQHSFTSGWSGGLKIPFGLEGGVNNAETFAEKQMTNPEIICAFTQFINDIPEEYQIIIGIDELDKLESDQQAQKFLNEIKSVFGLKRCFYLISVSENAMSNFERRGLPFRDAFDSSFDSIVYLDYFNLKEATLLLERRVIGKPMPFFYLSFCLSGGLPRDLIRAFRQLIEIRINNDNVNTLSKICLSIINSEIKAKIRAVTFVSTRFVDLPQTPEFLEQLFNLQILDITNTSLLQFICDLKNWQSYLKHSIPEEPGELKDLYKSLDTIVLEVIGYLSVMLTLLEFFNDNMTQESIQGAEVSDDFLKLAQSKQAMAINPLITNSIIKDFRASHNLATI